MSNGFKSLAQRNKCLKMVEDGSMSREQFDAYDNKTDLTKIPDRIHPKKDDIKKKK